ncbi:MAG: glycosyltransferase family 2 protein [Polyangiaceae bacterium]
MLSESPRVLAIIAAYNEADVIAQVIGDLVEQQVSVYLIDHRSTDGTVEEASRFLGRGLVAIERFPDESGFPPEDGERFAWEAILRRKEQLAATLAYDWVIHADADELRESPWPGVPLGPAVGAVDRLGYNAIDFALFQFRPVHDDFVPGGDLRSAFTHYELPRHFDILQVKCWKNTGPVALVPSGGHEAAFDGRNIFPLRFVLRHYPIRSQSHGMRKVFRERCPRFIESEHGRWHLQYDDITPETNFIRSPDELIAWDPWAVRAELAIRNRWVESLETEVERLRAELSRR